MGGYNWTGEGKKIAILRSYAFGVKVKDIADEHGVSSANVCMIAKLNGVMRGSYVEREKSIKAPEIAVSVSEVKRLASKGLKLTHIAAYLRAPYRDVAAAIEL